MKFNKAGEVKIGVIVAIVVAVGAAAYFLSDPFRTKADAAYDQFSKWTPENIAKDPENYLNFCEKQAEQALVKLKASQISIAQNQASLGARQKATAEKITLGNKALDELKQLYKGAEGKFPISWNGRSLDENATKTQIINFSREVEAAGKLQATVEAGLKKLEAQVSKVQEAKSEADQQISQIKTSREMLKVQKITDDLSKQLMNIGSALQGTLATVSDTTGPITLDQLKAESATTVNEDEFNKIMGN